MVNNHISYPASDRSLFSMLRKGIHKQACTADFSEKKISQIDIVVAEMTTNLLKYAVKGEILCTVKGEGLSQYIELISIDHGPGIDNLQSMLLDGSSTSNTLGYGLGSIKRLSNVFSIYTLKNWGTIVLSRIYKTDDQKYIQQHSLSSLILPKPPETLSGDGCMYKDTERYFKLLVLDGLGHGLEASKVVQEAYNNFILCPYHDPAEIIRFLHLPLKKTRGGVGTVVVIDKIQNECKILGVGNISTKLLFGNDDKNIMSYNGIIGHNIPNTMSSHSIPKKDFRYLILCSDGIKSRWDISKFPMILRYDPMIMAAAIYKDYGRQTDDTSVIILKVTNYD
jgi:anti-sigma regulatory factor (Ser/Thr protein kinase)